MKYTRVFTFLALAGMAGSAFATNGYFSHGYGMKSKGMAGVSTTNTEDAFGGANNPAAMAFAGNRFDLGVDLFSPIREASRTGSAGHGGVGDPGRDFSSESDSNYHLVPELGYVQQMNSNLALGVTVYGNGGMNTDYPGDAIDSGVTGFCDADRSGGPTPADMGQFNALCGKGRLGVDLMQLIVAPTVAYKVAPNHSIGVSPLLGYQRFEAEGLQAFGVMTATGGNLGSDNAFGYGLRVGYLGKISPAVTLGAAYATKMDFEEFDTYKGLFADKGDFDIPENYNLGVSWQITPALRLAADYQRINYSGVDSVGNPTSNIFNCPGFNPSGTDIESCLGGSRGAGFGWDDMKIWKIAVEHKVMPNFTLRAGYSHTDSPIKGATALQCGAGSEDCAEVVFNILAPAVIEDHVTVGFTYTMGSGNELTMAYMHAFENEVSGYDPMMGGTDTIKMYQDSIGIQYSWKM